MPNDELLASETTKKVELTDSWDQAVLGEISQDEMTAKKKGIRFLSLQKRTDLRPVVYSSKKPAIVPLKKFLVPFMGLTIFVALVLDLKVFPQLDFVNSLTSTVERVGQGLVKIADLSDLVPANQTANLNSAKMAIADTKIDLGFLNKTKEVKELATYRVTTGLVSTYQNGIRPALVLSQNFSSSEFLARPVNGLKKQIKKEWAMMSWFESGLVSKSNDLAEGIGAQGYIALNHLGFVTPKNIMALTAAVPASSENSSASQTNQQDYDQSWFDSVRVRLSDFYASLADYLSSLPDKSLVAWQDFLGLDQSADGTSASGTKPVSPEVATTTSGLEEEEQISAALYDKLKKELEASIKNQMKSAIVQSTGGTVSSEGLIVYPSSGSSTLDYQKQQQIQKAFSDKVVVNFSQSGQSGVVTPVFKNAVGSNYLFILTPINK